MASLNERRTWTGTSPEGLEYEVQFWGEGSMNEGNGMWNYYVTIPKDQLRPEDWERVWLPVAQMHHRSSGREWPSYDEYNSILQAGDFHGGITFYEKGQTPDTEHQWIKVGCDYGHAWDRDRGYGYSVEEVQRDALRTCRELAAVLSPLVRCTWSGQYFDPRFSVGEDVPGWKGGFLSPAGLGSKSMWSRVERERRERRAA